LLSSWRIDEMSSMKIIQSFLFNLNNGDTKSEALQKVKLDFLEQTGPRTANPIYWVGLNITGNNEPIIIINNYSFLKCGLFLTLALVVGLFWIYNKNRF
jgi:hypothetical protein